MNQNAGHTVNSNNGHKRRRLETNGHVPNVNPQPAIPPRMEEMRAKLSRLEHSQRNPLSASLGGCTRVTVSINLSDGRMKSKGLLSWIFMDILSPRTAFTSTMPTC